MVRSTFPTNSAGGETLDGFGRCVIEAPSTGIEAIGFSSILIRALGRAFFAHSRARLVTTNICLSRRKI
jgi:hypothetical protein